MQQAGMSMNDSMKKIRIPGKDMLNDFKESPKFVEDELDDKSANGSQSGYFSILHKGYSKLLPIVKELYSSCVREDGEEQHDLDQSNSPEEIKNIGTSTF